jgi:DNA transposition AAA+ family ATPase
MTTDEDPRNLVNQLATDARVLKQARRLPMGKLDRNTILAVRHDFVAYVQKTGVTDAKVAAEVGVAPATISQFRNYVYQGDNERIARLLNDWMEHHARKQPSDYVKTKVAEEIRAIVEVACTTSSMAAIVAPSGSGKTMVLKVLADKYRGRYLYCTEHMRAGSLLKALGTLVEVKKNRGTGGMKSRSEMLMQIVEKLAGTNRPLFLDEAHQLPRDAFPTVRAIHDQTQIPIIMAGAAEILDRINDRTQGRGQFASRCYQYNVLEHVANVEEDPNGSKLGRSLFSQEEIAKFLDNLEVKLERGGFELLWAIASLPNHGCLRTVRRLVHLLRQDKARRSTPITRKEVIWALGLLFGQTGNYVGRKADEHLHRVKAA